MGTETELTPYLNALTQHISCNEQIIQTLKSLRRKTEDLQKTSRAFQVTGTTFGVVASATAALGYLLAPATGGLSLGIPALFFGTTVGSVEVAVVGGIRDNRKTTKLETKIEMQQKEHVRSVEKVKVEQDKIREICKILNTKGYSTDVAMVSTLACLGSNTFKFAKGTKDAIGAAKLIQRAIESQSVTKLLADTGIKVFTSVRATGPAGFSVIFPSAEALAKLSPSKLSAFGKLSKNPKFFGPGMKGFKSLAIVGVVFSVVEVTMLFKNWNEPHQLTGIIEQFIKNLVVDCEVHQNYITFITFIIDKSSKTERSETKQNFGIRSGKKYWGRVCSTVFYCMMIAVPLFVAPYYVRRVMLS